MKKKDKTKIDYLNPFAIPPELKPAFTKWVQEKARGIGAGKLPYIKDGLLYSLWKYANAKRLTGKSLVSFADLLPLEGTDRFMIYEFVVELKNIGIELENITFNLEIYKKFCPKEHEHIETYMKDGRSKSFNEAMGKIFQNRAKFDDIFTIFGQFDELAKIKLRLGGLMEFIEFSPYPSERNLKPLQAWLDEYLRYFIEDKLSTDELKNFYKFSKQKEIFLHQIKNELRNYGAEFIFKQGDTVSVVNGISTTIGQDEKYLFIHTLAALEMQGYFEVERILIVDMDTPPEKQTDDYKVKIKCSGKLLDTDTRENESTPAPVLGIKRDWIEFFKDMGIAGVSGTKTLEELEKELSGYIPFGPITRNFLEQTDAILTEKPNDMRKMDWVFSQYNSTPYSLEKSRSIILASLDKLSEKYETIPLVYTTLPLPSYINYGSNVWREIFSTHSFEKEDYGHIDFLNALVSLINEGAIGLLFFETLSVNEKSLVLKATVTGYKKEPASKIISTQTNASPSFDENKSVIICGDNECKIPPRTNQYFLCQKMFQEPTGKRISEQEVLDLIDWDKDSRRSVYDAMRAVNKRAKSDLKIEELFAWRNSHIWRR